MGLTDVEASRMDKWKAVQALVVSGVLTGTAAEVLAKEPGDNPHAETGVHGSAERIGVVLMTDGSTGAMTPPPVGQRKL